VPKLFTRTDTKTARKTLQLFKHEIAKDKQSFFIYATFIPLNRLLYIVLLPFIFSLIIQSLITHPHDWQHPAWRLVVAGIISVLSLITADVGFKRLFFHEERIRTTLTQRAIDALLRHSDQFFSNRKIGTLAGDVNTFSGSILDFLDVIFMQASGIIINFTASLIIIAILSPVLLLPLTAVTALIVWRSIVGTAKRGPIRHKRKLLTSQLNGTVADILGNQQIVRYFATGDRELQRVIKDRQEIEDIAVHEIYILQRESIIRQSTLFIFQIITMAVCIWLFANGNVSIAALIFAVTYLGRLTSSLFDISPIIRTLEQAFLNAANITDILSENPEVIDQPKATQLETHGGAIELRDVSFSYSDSKNNGVIHHLSLNVAAGERIGLAGHSGGGKTTLAKLVLRFADIDKGEILIDGQNIAHVTQQSLRENIAYVPQEAYLFHRTLRENIAYGRPDATDEQIMEAVRRANAAEFVEALPEQLDTVVGERGVKLSGGQRQRIAIARAILKDAPILVLDEATSALDSESEKLIQDALEKLMKGRTSIVIAHRLSTIAKLDRIIVLDKGEIIEQGTHNALITRGGTYAKLWSHQSGGFIEE
jgi:ATP-binding cassette subfamily B protein